MLYIFTDQCEIFRKIRALELRFFIDVLFRKQMFYACAKLHTAVRIGTHERKKAYFLQSSFFNSDITRRVFCCVTLVSPIFLTHVLQLRGSLIVFRAFSMRFVNFIYYHPCGFHKFVSTKFYALVGYLAL